MAVELERVRTEEQQERRGARETHKSNSERSPTRAHSKRGHTPRIERAFGFAPCNKRNSAIRWNEVLTC